MGREGQTNKMRLANKLDNLTARNIVLHRLTCLGYFDELDGGGNYTTGQPVPDPTPYDTPSDPYGSNTYGPPSPVSVNSNDVSMSGNSGFMSDISSLVKAFAGAGAQIYTAVSGGPKPGQLVYNPATGTYQQAGAMTTRQTASLGGSFSNPLVLLAGIALLVLLLKK